MKLFVLPPRNQERWRSKGGTYKTRVVTVIGLGDNISYYSKWYYRSRKTRQNLQLITRYCILMTIQSSTISPMKLGLQWMYWNPHEIFTGILGVVLLQIRCTMPKLIGFTVGVSPRCNWPLFIHTGVSKVVVCQAKVRRSQEHWGRRGDDFLPTFLGRFLGETYGSFQGWRGVRLFFYSKKLTNTIPGNRKKNIYIYNICIQYTHTYIGLITNTKRNLQDFYTGLVLIIYI